MELETTLEITKVDEYKALILKRDHLKKETIQLEEEYYRKFGEYIKTNFELKIACIRLKKMINYCQMCLNRNEEIVQSNLDSYISSVMEAYYEELDDLIKCIQSSKNATVISFKDLKEIKKIYRYIAKKIHPDIHPELFKQERVKELWNRTKLAYECNDLDQLQEIQVLVDSLGMSTTDSIHIENLEERIDKIKREIDTILNSESYQYKFLFDDITMIENKIVSFKQEQSDYQNYKEQLETIFNTFKIRRYYA